MVRQLPLTDPGEPDLRSAGRFLRWVAREQRRTLLAGALWGSVAMLSQAVAPAALGRAIDAGVRHGSRSALVGWAAVLLALGLVQAAAGILRHRCAVDNYLTAVFRTQQLVVRHAAALGGSLSARVPAGEAANVSATDAASVGRSLDVTARATGAVVSFVAVAGLLLTTSPLLGLVVLVGVPVLVLGVGPLIKPLHRRQAAQRATIAAASTLAADTVSGLRVLRGIGGEAELMARYRAASRRTREAGVALARVEATLAAVEVLLPGLLLVVVTVVGVRLALAGSISAGQLVSFYGYAAFLVTPLRTATEFADKLTRALVAAGKVVGLLRLQPLRAEPLAPAEEPPAGVALTDLTTGVVVEPGLLTAVACVEPGVASALAERLGGHVEAPVLLGEVLLSDLPLSVVRRRVVVADASPWLFRGRLRDELDPFGTSTEGELLGALSAASALDVLEGLPEGLDTELEERARELSGGQRQRVVLARTLLTDADVLVLDEPTSSVDAHTEARIAQRLRQFRSGRSTLVLTTSPLVLEACDVVQLLADGRVVARGTHADLLHDPAYRRAVAREEVLS